MSAIRKHSVNKKANFTIISNDILFDTRLSCKAIGIFCKLWSLPPSWDFSLSGFASIVSDGIEGVKNGLKELEKYGYVAHARSRNDDGKLSGCVYDVYDSPALNPNYKPCAEKPCVVKPYEAETPQLKNQFNKESNAIKNQSYQSADMIDEIDNATKVCSIEERDEYLRIIRNNIDYGDISEKEDVDEIVELMLDVICSTGKTVRTNSGDMPHETVKQRFLELNGEHIDYVLTALRKNTTKVHNIRAYLITMLYNAPTTYKSYYTSWVNHDMYG